MNVQSIDHLLRMDYKIIYGVHMLFEYDDYRFKEASCMGRVYGYARVSSIEQHLIDRLRIE